MQQIVFKYDSGANTLEIFQKNTDDSWGSGALEDTCFIDPTGE
ncbi:MAG: hypothetical protein Q4A16_01735 [Lautropia sp.]|nr:hypothetical protein [Lautropia sp.]